MTVKTSGNRSARGRPSLADRPTSTADLIRFEGVTLGYRGRAVLTDLSFSISRGQFFGIVGPNGSGKTTVLRAMLGILPPLKGRILWGVGETPTHCGYVPQRGFLDELYPLSVFEVALMGCYGRLGPWRRPSPRERALAGDCLERVGIGGFGPKPYRDLSGGQKQRVLIARALVAEPLVLVLDEPTDGMDLEGQCAIMNLIQTIRVERGVTVIFVTHRLNELVNAAQWLMLLHEGRVRIGEVNEILTAEVLRTIYDVDVRVEHINGKRVIVT